MSRRTQLIAAILAFLVLLVIATDQRPDDTSIRTALAAGIIGLFSAFELLAYRHSQGVLSAERNNWILFFAVAFMALCTLSSAWALEPSRTLRTVAIAWCLLLAWFATDTWVKRQPLSRLLPITRNICIAIMFLTALIFIEIVTDQAIHRYLVNKLGMSMSIPNYYALGGGYIKVRLQFLSQHMGTLSYLFWPTLMGIYLTFGKWKYIGTIAFSILTIYSVFHSINETAMIALFLGAVAFSIGLLLPRTTIILTGFAMFLSVMTIIPVVYLFHDVLMLQSSPYIPPSGQARIPIWYEVASRVGEHPFLGHGVVDLQALVSMGQGFIWEHAHSHSVFMQTWYETGLLGATLLLGIGLSTVGVLYSYPRSLVCFGVATLISVMVSFATTAWELWVPWHLGAVCLTAIISLFSYRVGTLKRMEYFAKQ